MASRRNGPFEVFRIADRRHKIFDGQGAALHGARWNSPGRRIIYAAETYAGAMLEILTRTNIGRPPRTHSWIKILIGKNIRIEEVDARDVPGWDASDLRASRAFGDRWYDEARSAVLIVPSIVARQERNIAINQDHPDFIRIRATPPKPVIWDQRLFGR
ncbi:MAG TPA: RES domain-containing protein [Bryobacteraceae bacterium]|nr:RES domain-containing protein [Bryobacteraceae bacterium]